MTQNMPSLSKYIDHTLLRPGAADHELKRVCDEAREFGFYSVCVYWDQVGQVAAWLQGSDVLPIAVVGFPGGEVATAVKISETNTAVQSGAREIDMVIKRSLLKAGDDAGVLADISAVVKAAGKYPVKVILENSELTRDEKIRACQLSVQAGALFVKTSTGFSTSGATADDVALMRETVGPNIGVKASGGIRSYDKAIEMIRSGANRLGTSASVDIVKGANAQGSGY
jgi:deoxyribose-phosphate aldolase